jgi:hypothetical protein
MTDPQPPRRWPTGSPHTDHWIATLSSNLTPTKPLMDNQPHPNAGVL